MRGGGKVKGVEKQTNPPFEFVSKRLSLSL